MAQTNINHIDGYSQGPSTLCKYQPGDLVPGLNVGGWHDAGDYDLRVESQAGEAISSLWLVRISVPTGTRLPLISKNGL